MRKFQHAALAALTLTLLAGCATTPSGPSVMALPGTGKSFDQFRHDDALCREYAREQTGGTDASEAARDAGVRSAAVGTAVGAAAGALIGGREGAGVGAGTGLIMGGAIGSEAAQSSARGTQRSYDQAYIQCMYAKGQRVPTSGRFADRGTGSPAPAPAPALPGRANAPYPPPPPGHQPPAASAPPTAAQSGRGNWYYCASAREYYPYVRTCREGWQVVEASPPPAAR
ncbi:YMGG-like glycine zipper-containing protein [Methyloversatilis discipulorum]|jgi:hypothetical protein|uniref:YMGG-like glycine zipper-containing protein n=1 Tax=Methyloversatilis discipulorum TaxID=1119528 RepID=UPI0003650AB0|nr:YMGG-like glycine zipper-containing protein [Methyloversatilis discipulorum]